MSPSGGSRVCTGIVMTFRRALPLLAPLAFALACASRTPPSAPATEPATTPAPEAPAAAPMQQSAPTSATAAPQETPGPSSAAADDENAKRERLDTLPEAQAALDRASQVLDRMYVASNEQAPSAPGGGAAAGAAAPAPAARKTARAEGASCDTACKAFDSLRRAADAICRLAGDDDARCARGKKVVGDNEKRVSSCGCH